MPHIPADRSAELKRQVQEHAPDERADRVLPDRIQGKKVRKTTRQFGFLHEHFNAVKPLLLLENIDEVAWTRFKSRPESGQLRNGMLQQLKKIYGAATSDTRKQSCAAFRTSFGISVHFQNAGKVLTSSVPRWRKPPWSLASEPDPGSERQCSLPESRTDGRAWGGEAIGPGAGRIELPLDVRVQSGRRCLPPVADYESRLSSCDEGSAEDLCIETPMWDEGCPVVLTELEGVPFLDLVQPRLLVAETVHDLCRDLTRIVIVLHERCASRGYKSPQRWSYTPRKDGRRFYLFDFGAALELKQQQHVCELATYDLRFSSLNGLIGARLGLMTELASVSYVCLYFAGLALERHSLHSNSDDLSTLFETMELQSFSPWLGGATICGFVLYYSSGPCSLMVKVITELLVALESYVLAEFLEGL
ncbi:hypothetical protein SELMODRAFT_425695 [Selaginella moellendorffii]|uniref:Protein kinase domain-containing protein n=1 Tax=Selaginella moellendorffii TaxID=88036 RepID=D8STZ5_SELML|nr:hypothetical protein SELMODRAFT_425695 [Selaginella moellendorffii]